MKDIEDDSLCGAPAHDGPCVLPRGHNMGRLDIPSNHLAKLPNGQYYAKQTDGHMMLCNANGKRSIFDDVDE